MDSALPIVPEILIYARLLWPLATLICSPDIVARRDGAGGLPNDHLSRTAYKLWQITGSVPSVPYGVAVTYIVRPPVVS